MKAVVLNEYNKVEWTDVRDPEVRENDVLVRIRYASICGTDQHIFKGEFHPRTQLPLIPGHEFAGTVEKLGTSVKDFAIGDKVTVDPIIWCGSCFACKMKHYPACETLKLVGIDLDGGFAEYISVPATMVHKFHSHIPDRHAALIEVLAIGFHACNRAGVKQNDSIAIFGAGKLGQCILQAAKNITKSSIFLIDILDKRLQIPLNTYDNIIPINPLKENPVDSIRERTKGEGVDVAFEAVGHPEEIEGQVNPVRACIQSIRPAGTVCVLGLSDYEAPLVMKELIWKEARIIASRVSHGEYKETIQALSDKKLNPQLLISKTLPAQKAQEAFELLEDKPEENLKILLKF